MPDTPRQVAISIKYDGSDGITSKELQSRIKQFTYEDPASGESDTISVELDNENAYFLKKIPQKGSKITAEIQLYSWEKLGEKMSISCGTFCCDTKEFSGWPLTCTIGATSVPEKQAFRVTQRSKVWKKTTIKEIANKLCSSYALRLVYDAGTINIAKLEQTDKTDCAFLTELCEKYDLYIKVYAGKVYIYDPVKYEAKKSIKSIKIDDMLQWSYTGSLIGTYTGGTIKYTAGDEEKEYTCKVGSGSRIYSMSEKVDSLADAKLQITAKINSENRSAETMTCTIEADRKITAGVNITVKGADKIDGKYFVDKVTHTESGDAPYTMELTMHKVQTAVVAAPEPAKKTVKKQTPKKLEVGQIVTFTGNQHYYSSNWSTPKYCKPGKARITMIYNGKHPYHLIRIPGGGSTVWGWVDTKDISV